MGTRKIVITGGPGTGKSSIINALLAKGYTCLEEISRAVTLQAQKKGVTQLFLSDPMRFSSLLLEGRLEQFKTATASASSSVFLDRGIHDILAYLNYSHTKYPEHFKTTAAISQYDFVFSLKPWQAIYKSDNERYETFAQAQVIHEHLIETYKDYGYTPINVPFGSVDDRTAFILNTLGLK